MKVVHEVEKCIGCGTCVALCPALFEMEGAKAKLKDGKMDEAAASLKENLRQRSRTVQSRLSRTAL